LVAELAIVENLQRKDLNPIEKALSFQRYLHEHQCTQDDLGRRIKIDRSTIANLMRLLELPDELQAWLRDGRISAGHARALLPLGDPRQQLEFARRIQDEQISVRATEEAVQQMIARDDGVDPAQRVRRGRARNRSSQLAALERELKHLLGTKVEIRSGPHHVGKIVLHFRGGDEFERLRQTLIDGAAGSRS
jgi:ParB family chromosome partitioning protein